MATGSFFVAIRSRMIFTALAATSSPIAQESGRQLDWSWLLRTSPRTPERPSVPPGGDRHRGTAKQRVSYSTAAVETPSPCPQSAASLSGAAIYPRWRPPTFMILPTSRASAIQSRLKDDVSTQSKQYQNNAKTGDRSKNIAIRTPTTDIAIAAPTSQGKALSTAAAPRFVGTSNPAIERSPTVPSSRLLFSNLPRWNGPGIVGDRHQ